MSSFAYFHRLPHLTRASVSPHGASAKHVVQVSHCATICLRQSRKPARSCHRSIPKTDSRCQREKRNEQKKSKQEQKHRYNDGLGDRGGFIFSAINTTVTWPPLLRKESTPPGWEMKAPGDSPTFCNIVGRPAGCPFLVANCSDTR